MIEVEGLTKHYGKVAALSNVSFRVNSGSVVGFLGPNGAGKSTTLRILSGFLGPTSGRASVGGIDVLRFPIEARRQLGYMPESAPLYPEMRVREYLGFRSELKGVARRARKAAVARALGQANAEDVEDDVIQNLSRGYRQRVALADALIADPPLLILDEPTAGLDPNQVRQVRKLIANLASDRTVLLSTHILSEVEATCDRAIVIHRGHQVAEGSLDELRRLRQPDGLRLKLRGSTQRLQQLLAECPSVKTWHSEPEAGPQANGDEPLSLSLSWRSEVVVPLATEQLFRELALAEIGVQHVEPLVASLEDVFSQLTREPPPSADEKAP